MIQTFNYNRPNNLIKMYYHLFSINNLYFISIRTSLLNMTVNNPLFVFAIIIVIWFIPGIIVRRFNESKQLKKKEKYQADAIRKLYPKSKE